VRKRLIGAAVAALGLGTFAIPALSGAAPGSPQGGTGGPVACGSGSITWSPDNLWPPNHKLQTVTITYTGDNDGDTAMVAVTGWSDKDSRVANHARRDRNYYLLADLGTGPRTSYLGKLRNPNPEMV